MGTISIFMAFLLSPHLSALIPIGRARWHYILDQQGSGQEEVWPFTPYGHAWEFRVLLRTQQLRIKKIIPHFKMEKKCLCSQFEVGMGRGWGQIYNPT